MSSCKIAFFHAESDIWFLVLVLGGFFVVFWFLFCFLFFFGKRMDTLAWYFLSCTKTTKSRNSAQSNIFSLVCKRVMDIWKLYHSEIDVHTHTSSPSHTHGVCLQRTQLHFPHYLLFQWHFIFPFVLPRQSRIWVFFL